MYWWDEFFHAFDSIFFSEGKNDRQLCFLLSISIKFKMAVMESPIRLSMLNLMLMEGVGLQISFDKSLY